MAQMIQIRQRIKAIETIKKITHAMRLISMSSHTKLKGQQEPLFAYKHAIAELFSIAKAHHPSWQHPLSSSAAEDNVLVILVGSQKGLCGNFNNSLFYFFEEELKTFKSTNISYIAVGKKALEHLQKKSIEPIVYYKNVSAKTIERITQSLINDIQYATPQYSRVVLFSNQTKTFFLQKPTKRVLVPFEPSIQPEQYNEDYYWEQPAEELLPILAQQLMTAQLHALLFDSLLSEQAARFISMDGATRNANTLLEQTRLTYNKLRQFSITKELSELMGNL